MRNSRPTERRPLLKVLPETEGATIRADRPSCLIDIVICTYNRADDLDQCLAAMAAQTADRKVWRVLVIDNNCTDRTAEVVDRWIATGRLPGLTRIVETNQGLTPSRQRGVRESRADWIAFVDDDCILAPDWIDEALRFARAHPHVGGFGGRVRPEWGGPPPPHLAGNAWLFALQDRGDMGEEVASLVGAGAVLNRNLLNQTGWTAHPFLADRTARGHVSGGDVEISARLRRNGHTLHYVPSMFIAHRIASARQGLRQCLGLARGLGAGAELVSLMCAPDEAKWLASSWADLRHKLLRHVRALPYVLAQRYSGWDWLVHAAFLSGQYGQHRQLRANAATRSALAGRCAEDLGQRAADNV
jgi:glucosyl-dolichyl phosphate glucuronosyltransferase